MTDSSGTTPETDVPVITPDGVEPPADEPTPSVALIVHPATGEALDIKEAETDQLAAAVVEVDALTGRLKDFTSVISDELVDRLDQGGQWTERVPHPNSGEAVIKITAPSPDAGMTWTDPDLLDVELQQLVADGHVAPVAANRALERLVTVVYAIPIDQDVQAFHNDAWKDERVKKVDTTRKVVQSGVNALGKLGRKTPEVADALRRALRRRAEPPARKAKVTTETPKRGA